MKAIFKKGQTVFQVRTHIAETKPLSCKYIGAVISRTVDACGLKRCTFVDHGLDGVFGRTIYFSTDNCRETFTSAEEAFEYLEGHCDIALKRVFSDKNNEVFETANEIKARISRDPLQQ